MAYNDETLTRIYDKTEGYCHICDKKLSFTNYASRGNKGAWEVDHSRPLAKGGTHHLNNLYPACIDCNNEKGTSHKRTMRKKKGYYDEPQDSGGCYLTTACIISQGLPDDCYELQMLRKFRNEYVSKQKCGPEILNEYYKTAPKIINAINTRKNSAVIYSRMFKIIKKAVKFINEEDYKHAFDLYVKMANNYKRRFLQ